MDIYRILTNQIHSRLINEGIHRIKKCLAFLSDDEIYYRINTNTNSVGHLILHLNGNVRQWLIYNISKIDFTRDRDLEFDITYTPSRRHLIELLDKLEYDISILNVDKNINLSEWIIVQGFHEPILGVIIHVIEHFSYHTGQITYITKALKDIDTGFYENLDLNINS